MGLLHTQDFVRRRTNYRGDDFYVYRLDAPPQGARQLLLGYLEAVNRLDERPQRYNALTDKAPPCGSAPGSRGMTERPRA